MLLISNDNGNCAPHLISLSLRGFKIINYDLELKCVNKKQA